MKRLIAALLVLAVLCAGCSGVIMNAQYSRVLDRTVVIAEEAARRAEAGQLSNEQMVAALRWNAECWKAFQAARDGKETPQP